MLKEPTHNNQQLMQPFFLSMAVSDHRKALPAFALTNKDVIQEKGLGKSAHHTSVF